LDAPRDVSSRAKARHSSARVFEEPYLIGAPSDGPCWNTGKIRELAIVLVEPLRIVTTDLVDARFVERDSEAGADTHRTSGVNPNTTELFSERIHHFTRLNGLRSQVERG